MGIEESDIANITQYSHKKTKSLFESLQELPLISGISKNGREKIEFLLGLIKKHSQLAREKGVSELLITCLEDLGYTNYLRDKDARYETDLINQFLKKVKQFEIDSLEPTLKNFMEQMMLELESGEEGKLEFDPNEGPEMIKVMTIHGAKGLEFKYVFLANMVDKRFPTMERKDPIEIPEELIKDIKPKGDVHLQEERRLCYVAMTRAKRELYFLSADDYGGKQRKKISRFLVGMGYNQAGGKVVTIKEQSKIKTGMPKRKSEPVYSIPDHFSFSQLSTYEKCPLEYKYKYVLKIPQKGKAVFSFGTTIHNTLQEFLQAVNEVHRENQESLFGDIKEIPKSKKKSAEKIDLKFIKSLYEKNWVDEWYESKKQKDDYFKNGSRIIKEFYENFKKNPPKLFKINGEVALEVPFNLKIGENIIHGRIDRIDDNNGEIEIMDYKTGNPKDKLTAEEKEQLLIYKMAAQEVLKLKPKQLTYHYLEKDKKMSFVGTEQEVENLKNKITEIIKKIKNNEFEKVPGHDCEYCDFKELSDL